MSLFKSKIFKYLSLICIIFVSHANAQITPYIIGGIPAGQNDYPFIVSLAEPSGNQLYHFCGGSLIDKRWVLTAAHCVADGSVFKIRANTLDSTTGGEVIDVSNVYVHPQYNGNADQAGDIALVKLSRDVTSVNPVRLADQSVNNLLVANTTVSVAGWGYTTNTNQSTSRYLMKVDVPIVGQSTCNTIYQNTYGTTILDQMVCAGTAGKDSCNGDSGGPLVLTDNTGKYLVGLVSFGPSECGSANIPGVYTRVYSYLSWINQTIGTTGAPGEFNIISPSFDQRFDTRRPTITWSLSSNAQFYRLIVQNINTLATFTVDTTNRSYTFTSDLASGRYAFKIEAYNGNLKTSSSIYAFYINLNKPVINALSPNYTTRRPTVSWSSVAGATSYRIYFKNTTSGGVLDVNGINSTSYTPTADLISGAYQVYVLANGSVANSSWSLPGRFSINFSAPTVINVSSTSRRPTISWNTVQGAPNYEIYIKNVTNPSYILIGRSTSNTYVPSSNLLPGYNDVWVRVATPDAITVWSSPKRFLTN